MRLEPGARLDGYEIVSLLGAGGMGEVYRARDATLGREVAIKVLPAGLAADGTRLARFEREAKSLAALNHPNVATLHGLFSARPAPDGSPEIRFLVLELVEGEDLAERLAPGPMSVEEALPLFLQIVHGLEAAHQAGIVHRDLKPDNLKVATGGGIKILDFGLAKLLTQEASSNSASGAPTMTASPTRDGQILGTAAYMSPEQARGEAVDQRADIWAFGCVLYEALCGQRPFAGRVATDEIASVLKDEPDWSLLPAATPPSIRTLLRRSLEKDPHRRLRDIGDARLEIEDAIAGTELPIPAAKPAGEPAPRGLEPRLIIPLLALVLGLLVAAGWGWLRPLPTRSRGLTDLDLEIPKGRLWGGRLQDEENRAGGIGTLEVMVGFSRPSRASFSISPDGRSVAFAAIVAGEDQGLLYLRRLDDRTPVPLPGTEGGSQPFFSPDSSWLGYVGPGEREIWRTPAGGGESRSLAKMGRVASPSWTEENAIVFAGGSGDKPFQIFRTSTDGGAPEMLTEPAEGHQLFPELLPGGEWVLYTQLSGRPFSDRTDSKVVAQRKGEEPVVLIENAMAARRLSNGHLVFARQGRLMSLVFDADRLTVKSEPVGVLESLMQSLSQANPGLNLGFPQYAVSQTGTLAYVSGGRSPGTTNRLLWKDPASGEEEGISVPVRSFARQRISPDGAKIALLTGFGGALWVIDPETDEEKELFSTGVHSASWSPDGSQLVVTLEDPGSPSRSLFLVDAAGRSEPQAVAGGVEAVEVSGWSTRNVLLFTRRPNDIVGAQNRVSLWTLKLGSDQPEPFGDPSAHREHLASFSPDGRWIAYTRTFLATENGPAREMVYVRRYPDTGSAWQVADGKGGVVWSKDQRRLFILAGGDAVAAGDPMKMISVDVSTADGVFQRGESSLLFEGAYSRTFGTRSWDIDDEGRFLMGTRREREPQPVTSIRIVLDWFAHLESLVYTGS